MSPMVAENIRFIRLNIQGVYCLLAGPHPCLAANLRIGIYNGETVFNISISNSWSDLDDFFSRPPLNFNFDEMVKKSAL